MASVQLSRPEQSWSINSREDPNSQHYDRSNLITYIDKRIIQEVPVNEGGIHLIIRIALLTFGVIAGFAGRIPYIELNMKLGGDNKIYGGFLAYGNCISFGYLISYTIIEIINSQMKPLSDEEQKLSESRMTPSIRKILFTAALIFGFSSQIPFAYIAYKYNAASTLNPGGLLMPIMIFAIDSWVYVYSSYMGLKTLRENQIFTPFEKQLKGIGKKLCEAIENTRNSFIACRKEEKATFINSYENTKKDENTKTRINNIYNLCNRKISNLTQKPSSYVLGINYIVKAYGYLCTASNIGTLGYIAWLGANQLTHSAAAGVIATALYVGTALYLNTTAIPDTAVKLINLFKDLVTWKYQPTLSDQLTPKLSFSLKVIGLATAALSYGAAVQLSKDYFGFSSGFEIFMATTLSSATFFLVSMAILFITDQILEYKIEIMNSDEDKKIMVVQRKMKLLSSRIASSPPIETAFLLKTLPRDAVSDLIKDTEIDSGSLERYISKYLQKNTDIEKTYLLAENRSDMV